MKTFKYTDGKTTLYVDADGPGHAAFQIHHWRRDVKRRWCRKQTQVSRYVHVLGSEASRKVRENDLTGVIPVVLEDDR